MRALLATLRRMLQAAGAVLELRLHRLLRDLHNEDQTVSSADAHVSRCPMHRQPWPDWPCDDYQLAVGRMADVRRRQGWTR